MAAMPATVSRAPSRLGTARQRSATARRPTARRTLPIGAPVGAGNIQPERARTCPLLHSSSARCWWRSRACRWAGRSPRAPAASVRRPRPPGGRASRSQPRGGVQAFDEPLPDALSPRNASYDIAVRLDPVRKELKGRETIRWRNISAATTNELQFHLYWNAWRNADSSWLREDRLAAPPARRLQDAERRPEEAGAERRHASARHPGRRRTRVDLTGAIRYIAPDDGNAADRTVMAVTLPAAGRARAAASQIEIEWTGRIPFAAARTGWIADYFFFGQWFPKIGVLEDTGWNTHQFHRVTEFYADFGVYDVQMTVPGRLQGGRLGPGNAARGQRRRHDHPHLPRRRRRRLRLDHEPVVHRGTPRLQPRDAAERGDAAAAAARAPRPGDAALRGHGGRARALRRVVRRLSLRQHHHRRSRLPERQRRHGVPDALHRPCQLAGAGAGARCPSRRSSTRPGTSGSTASSPPTSSSTAGWTRASPPGPRRASSKRRACPTRSRCARSARFLPYTLDVPLSREVSGNRMPTYRPDAEADAQTTPTFRYWPRSASAITYDKTALWMHTLERHLGLADDAARDGRLLRPLEVPAPAAARISSRSSTR